MEAAAIARRRAKALVAELLQPSFYKGFWLYTWATIVITALILVAFQSDLAYIDAFYIAASGFCEIGLTARDLSQFTSAASVMLGVIMLLGSGVLQTCVPLVLRRFYFNPATATRNELLEYQCMGKLLRVIQVFFWGTLFLSFLILTVWLANDPPALAVLTRNKNSPMGWSAFLSISGFLSNGLSTLPDNFVELYAFPVPLLLMSYVTLVGETMYPIMLRLIIWVFYKLSVGTDRKLYRYILKHPRRLYTHLFSLSDTLWLLCVVIGIDLVEFVFMAALSWDSAAFSFMSPAQKILNMYFMATTTRTSGFNSVNPVAQNYGMLALYCGTMYLSVAPVYAIMRQSMTDRRAVGFLQQAKRLLVQDAVYLFLIFVAVCIIENDRIETDASFTPFSIIFEIISAYGTVGLSFGYPTNPNSFSSVWRPLSKFLIACAMIIGRLRGVPRSDERAVQIKPAPLVAAPALPMQTFKVEPSKPASDVKAHIFHNSESSGSSRIASSSTALPPPSSIAAFMRRHQSTPHLRSTSDGIDALYSAGRAVNTQTSTKTSMAAPPKLSAPPPATPQDAPNLDVAADEARLKSDAAGGKKRKPIKRTKKTASLSTATDDTASPSGAAVSTPSRKRKTAKRPPQTPTTTDDEVGSASARPSRRRDVAGSALPSPTPTPAPTISGSSAVAAVHAHAAPVHLSEESAGADHLTLPSRTHHRPRMA